MRCHDVRSESAERERDLSEHIRGDQVVLVLQEAYRGDRRVLVEAGRLPAMVPSAASLPQVDAEDLARTAAVKQDGRLEHERRTFKK